MATIGRAKKNLVAGFLGGLLLFASVLQAGPVAADTARIVSPPEEEKLVYDISFLIFRNAAVGSLTMRYLPERDLYEGVVAAQTRGLIGFLSLYRKDTYRSLMKLSPDGRLIPVEFHKEVRMGSSLSASVTLLDYQAGVMRWRSTEGNGDESEDEIKSRLEVVQDAAVDDSYKTKVETKDHPIPDGIVFEDFISAFFNLRRGFYGPIRPGKEIRVSSLPTRKWFKERQKKPQHFTVKVGERQVKEDGVSRLVISINVPKELFGQKVGDVRFLIREDNVPSKIIVKKAILFGDMRGKLRSRYVVRKQLAASPSLPAPGSKGAPASRPADPKRSPASPPSIFKFPGFSRSFR